MSTVNREFKTWFVISNCDRRTFYFNILLFENIYSNKKKGMDKHCLAYLEFQLLIMKIFYVIKTGTKTVCI